MLNMSIHRRVIKALNVQKKEHSLSVKGVSLRISEYTVLGKYLQRSKLSIVQYRLSIHENVYKNTHCKRMKLKILKVTARKKFKHLYIYILEK